MQIEFEEELYNLIFENEHQLGTKPKQIDILVIKKNENIPIRKNIGKIFRKYNIIEYKSPDDSLRINDFYKVMGYTYFYKADTRKQNSIKLEEITVTFVSKRYPRNMLKHLKRKGNVIEKKEDGILYIKGEVIPIQVIITSQLSEKNNFWLKSLTNDLKDNVMADKIIKKYIQHKDDNYYRSVMDIIVRANRKLFEEGNNMCDAMMEILKDRIDEMNQKSKEDGIRIGEERGERRGERRGEKRGKRQGRREGLQLAKKIMRMNAEGIDCTTIASRCYISVEEVKDILAF